MKNKLFYTILIVAALLRFVGTKPSFPPYHSDEGISYSSAVEMIKNGNLDPGRYDYPALVPLINYISFKYFFIPLSWIRYYISNLSNIWEGLINVLPTQLERQRIFQVEILGEREINALFWGRYVTAFFGVGVVFLTYLLGEKLFGRKTGLLSSLLVSVNYRQVLNSHLGLPDIYNAFFLLLSLVFAYLLWKRPSLRNYLLAGVTAGLSFSTKYQSFAFFPLAFAHLANTPTDGKWSKTLKFLLNPYALMVPLLIILVFLILNPYAIIKIEETRTWLSQISLKYRLGRNIFDFYPYSYLYHIGIGKLTSILVLAGILFATFKKKMETLFLLLVVIPFFLVTTYLTGGGFYTRNFVTITPILLIFAGFFLSLLLSFRLKILGAIFFSLLLFFCLSESLKNSLVVVDAYRGRWNFKILSDWVEKNIPPNSKVAAHSSVPLPVDGVVRLPYNFDDGPFSMEEFRELGVDYVVTNLDWATAGFYGWMTQDTKTSLAYWKKPLGILENTFAGMTVREITDFAYFWVLKPWQAPDSNFIVAKVPKYDVAKKTLISDVNFSKPLLVKGWPGYFLTFEVKTETAKQNLREGFLYLNFYKDVADANDVTKRVAVRLSKRATKIGDWEEISLAGNIPSQANYVTINFGDYDSNSGKSDYRNLKFYKAEVKTDFSGVAIKGLMLDSNLLYPNSHGNL